ncbi:MAG: ThiF family adenylyltransferase [Planctomycetota bacterium]|jgi:molybdopterin-synthase adenylyltransferase|nr:ThiF family adenylyltransferase [Planctomycetota bacterium]
MSDRFIRQERLPQIGTEGQAKLAAARVALVGVGATGSHLAASLGRAGVGRTEKGGLLRLIDRDIVELSNLPRQTLFTTADVESVRPKAEAAAEALEHIDPGLALEPVVEDLVSDNANQLLGDVDLVLDGTDNFTTRMLVNDLCVRDGRPWIYSGVVGTEGQLLVVRSSTACLRCYVPELPAPGTLPTCDTAGVLGSVVSLITSLVATESLKIILKDDDVRDGEVFVVDGWRGDVRTVSLSIDPTCPCCQRQSYEFLNSQSAAMPTELCGRNAIQLPPTGAPVDLESAAKRLAKEGVVTRSRFLVRLDSPDRRLLLFSDGRVIIDNTQSASEARSVRAKLLGD